MYQIETKIIEDKNYIEMYSKKSNAFGRISLNEGGRLDVLNLNKTQLITKNPIFNYKNSYASAILFPFANRINDGKYSFEGKTYNLKCNEVNRNNALHGLVYNKTFKTVKKEITPTFAKLEVQYNSNGNTLGFPFKYSISITYKLMQTSLSLFIKIENIDSKSFPFTLGWHPYFLSKDLSKSSLNFNSKVQVESNLKMITTRTSQFKTTMPFQIKNNILDNAYKLEDDKILFKTPEYILNITSTEKNNFLQLYTPDISNLIAIEPTTGVSDSFNNKMGLKTLKPNQTYIVEYLLNVEKI